MALDAAEQQSLRDHITRWQGGPLRCAVCGQQDWAQWQIEAARYIFEEPHTSVSVLDPVVALTCQQCGQVVTFDVAMAPLPGASAPGRSAVP